MATAASLFVSSPHVLQQGRTSEQGFRCGASILHFGAFVAAPAIHLRSSGVKGIKVAATAQLDSGEATQDDKARRRVTGLNKNWAVSPGLQKIVGEKELPRPEVIKRLWQYIRENNLQDPEKKRRIVFNAELAEVMGEKETDMFGLQRLLNNHLTYLQTGEPSTKRVPKKKKKAQDVAQVRGFKVPCDYRISDALKNFLGTDETHMDHHQAYHKVWEYVTANNLKDPSDRRRVICDEKLSKLLGVDTFIGLGMRKYLAVHITREDMEE